MFIIIRKIISLLNKQERRQLIGMTIAIITVGIIEVVGIASIMPFMAVVAKPEVINTNRYLLIVYQNLGFSSVDNYLIFLGFSVFFIMLLSNILKALVLWLELKFVHFRVHNFTRRLLFRYLSQPYEFFLNHNTSLLGKNILTEVFTFTHHVIRPCTQIFTMIVVVLFIFGLLLYVDPLLAVLISSILSVAYFVLYTLVQRKLARLGDERFEANSQRFKAAGEAFGGIKDLKVLNRQRFFFDRVSKCSYMIERNMITNGLISQLPRYMMEATSFGGILIIVLYFLMVRQDISQTLPVIALYTFAGYRLMPAMQGIFSGLTTVRFHLSSLDAIHHDLSGTTEVPDDWQQQRVTPLSFRNTIELNSVSFTYPGSETPVIEEMNLIINKNSCIGLVGGTGSGKTTTVDILLGLLSPQHGTLLVDGMPITSENILQWQRNLGYVPQSIFLCDDSLSANIAFGVPSEDIDMAAVEMAARIANLHNFVTNELPEGYATNIGERGVRLSGGQRQRIGIARALYHDPEVLIMDEATSALDGITEAAVIQAIQNLAGKKTIITIAHRLSTLRDSDHIYVIENGRIVEEGTYVELSKSSSKFRAMARNDKRDLDHQDMTNYTKFKDL